MVWLVACLLFLVCLSVCVYICMDVMLTVDISFKFPFVAGGMLFIPGACVCACVCVSSVCVYVYGCDAHCAQVLRI